MYIVTGGAGFIGSAIVRKLNQEGITDIVIVDNLGKSEKWKNLVNLQYLDYINKTDFINMLNKLNYKSIKAIIHMGACSSTTEKDANYMMSNNFDYSKGIASYAIEKNIRFIYASSAATYGDGILGFSDYYGKLSKLKPLNIYGYSKHIFDLAINNRDNLRNKDIVGLKFFNVFGPNEYHKGDMSSVVFKAFNRINDKGILKLFKSHKPEYKDGEQMRDFIYIKDCTDIIWWLLQKPQIKGLFNIGTDIPRTWNDLTNIVFKNMGIDPIIHYVDMPLNIKENYQYYTCAQMKKLREAGYTEPFMSLEEGIEDYIQNYLLGKDRYL